MRFEKQFGIFILVCFSFFAIWKNHSALFPHFTNKYFSKVAQKSVLQNGEKIKPFLLGFDAFIADIYWLRAIQYIGGNAAAGTFPVLEGYANTITDFDPQFRYVYHFGGLFLPTLGKYESARKLLEKGERNVPDDWQISYDLGFVHFYYRDDYESAIKAYQRCLQKEGCLPSSHTLINTLEAKRGKVEIAFFNMLEQYKNSSKEDQEFYAKKIEELGKLFVLQHAAQYASPTEDIQELLGVQLEMTKKVQSAIQVLESLTGKDLLDERGAIQEELLRNPFEFNPFFWDKEKQVVRPIQW